MQTGSNVMKTLSVSQMI